MKPPLVATLAAAGLLASTQAPGNCALVTLSEAEAVLGADIQDLSGEDATTQCFFLSNASGTMFIVQISNREYYENVTLQQPFDVADIGEGGRSRVESNGGAAVQFIQGDTSVMMTVRPTRPGGTDYIGILLEVAARTAAKL
jgi:hypothetical protein